MSGPPGSRAPAFVGPESTTTTPTAAVQVTPPTLAAAPTTAAPPPSAGSPPVTTVPPAAPLTPALPGTYRYDTSGQSRFGAATAPYPAVTTLVVEPPDGTRQHATRDLRDASRNGPVFESVLDYRADGVYLADLRVGVTVLLFTDVQELQPPAPQLLLPTGARPGVHLDLDIPGPAGTAHLAVDVVRDEEVRVAGQAVAARVVRLVASLPGQLDGRLELTVWVAPASRVWVKERAVADASTPDGSVRFHSEYDAILEQLSPS